MEELPLLDDLTPDAAESLPAEEAPAPTLRQLARAKKALLKANIDAAILANMPPPAPEEPNPFLEDPLPSGEEQIEILTEEIEAAAEEEEEEGKELEPLEELDPED
jgi:hypothetical protein